MEILLILKEVWKGAPYNTLFGIIGYWNNSLGRRTFSLLCVNWAKKKRKNSLYGEWCSSRMQIHKATAPNSSSDKKKMQKTAPQMPRLAISNNTSPNALPNPSTSQRGPAEKCMSSKSHRVWLGCQLFPVVLRAKHNASAKKNEHLWQRKKDKGKQLALKQDLALLPFPLVWGRPMDRQCHKYHILFNFLHAFSGILKFKVWNLGFKLCKVLDA